MKTIITASLILQISMIWAKMTAANIYPRYDLNYDVTEGMAQWESQMNGPYSLVEPDGNSRIVEYSDDDVNGFSALVKTIAAALNNPHPYLKPLFTPLSEISLPFVNLRSYGFGAANIGIGIPSVKVSGTSLPWDPKTGSFGGWIPIRRPTQRISKATIVSKKYVNGHLRTVLYRPSPLPYRSVILIKKKKINYG